MRHDPGKIIKIYKETGSIAKTAEILGIHRTTVWRWLGRAGSEYLFGEPVYRIRGLKRKSTGPKKVREPALSGDEKVFVTDVRRTYGFCAEKIKAVTGLTCSSKSIEREMKRSGLIKGSVRHRRPPCQNTVHMHAKNTTAVGYLRMDVKYLTPQLTGLPWTCFEYGVMDIYSRYKDAVILNHLNRDGAILALTEVVNRLPFKPVFIQTDNGLEFQKRFHEHAVALCGEHHYIHKSSPNENAVIERSFRTDEEEFIYRHTPFSDYDDLRHRYTEWLRWYNNERPHFGIDLKTPISVIQSSCQDVANVLSE